MVVSMKCKILFAVIALFAVKLCLGCPLSMGSEAERQAKGLARRIVPSYAERIDFRQTDDTIDVFKIYSKGSKLVIEGNNAISMATALNYFL